MVSLNQVSKKFHYYKAVDDVSFTVEEGETLVLLGTSGCGKTTTLKMINRLLQPDAGEISIHGLSAGDTSLAVLRRQIGYVMQQHGLFPHYTIVQNIGVVPSLLGWPPEKVKQRSLELMEKLHLPPAQLADKYPQQLSGGQQQRVGLARALAAQPPLLLMDEPFGSLDPVTRLHVRRDFFDLEEAGRKTIIMVTHDMEEAFELGDRICLMNQGRIEQLGTPADLLFRPASDFVKQFFDIRRTQLELQMITMKDVWAWLADDEEMVAIAEKNSMPAMVSAWQVLEMLTGTATQVQISHGQQQKIVNHKYLLQAVSQFKQSLTA